VHVRFGGKLSETYFSNKARRWGLILRIKQETLAFELGVSQQSVSRMEQSETIEDEVLEKVAGVLGVTAEAIKKFSDEAVINIISNTFSDFKDNASAINHNCSLNFNPIDKIVELYNEKVALLERLLQSEKEKNELLKGK
jgi:transcriptional regulator with XRE-family HTH domain